MTLSVKTACYCMFKRHLTSIAASGAENPGHVQKMPCNILKRRVIIGLGFNVCPD